MEKAGHGPYRRKTQALESVYIRYPGASAVLRAQVHGSIAENAFIQAARKLVKAYPLLNARVVRDENGTAWFEERGGYENTKIVPQEDRDTYRRVMKEERNAYLDVWNGPLSRFVLVRGADVSDIILICHHLIMDGPGLVLMMDKLLTLLADPAATWAPQADVLLDRDIHKAYHPRFSLGGQLRHWGNLAMYGFVKSAWKKTAFLLPQEDKNVESSEIFTRHFNADWYEDVLDEQQTSRLVKLFKDKNITVNTGLGAAFLYCRSQVDPENENSRQTVSVDLRRYFNGRADGQIGCFAGLWNLYYPYHSQKSFWENAQGFAKDIQKMKDGCQDARKAAYLARLPSDFYEAMVFAKRVQETPDAYKSHPHYDKMRAGSKHIVSVFTKGATQTDPSMLISNMGKVQLGPYGPYTVQQANILSPSFIGTTMIHVMTLNGRLNFTLNVTKPVGDRRFEEQADALRQRYHDFLTGEIFTL